MFGFACSVSGVSLLFTASSSVRLVYGQTGWHFQWMSMGWLRKVMHNVVDGVSLLVDNELDTR